MKTFLALFFITFSQSWAQHCNSISYNTNGTRISLEMDVSCPIQNAYHMDIVIYEEDTITPNDIISADSFDAHSGEIKRVSMFGYDKGDGLIDDGFYEIFAQITHNCTENGILTEETFDLDKEVENNFRCHTVHYCCKYAISKVLKTSN